MKTYSFRELKKKYKDRAIKDYEKGWLETHPDPEDGVSYDEVYSILLDDLDDERYSQFGRLLEPVEDESQATNKRFFSIELLGKQ